MNTRGRLRELEDERDDLLEEVSHLNRGNKVLEARVSELEKENRKLKNVLSSLQAPGDGLSC